MTAAPARCTDRQALLAIYERDRDVHPYGIADLVQLWDRSRWWRDGDAVVGLLDLPGSPLPVLYAIAAREQEPTLALLSGLARRGWLPSAFVITGPRGLAAHLAPGRTAGWSRSYVKHALRRPAMLPAADPAVRELTAADATALHTLHASDATAGEFFHPGLLETGAYVGLEVDGLLVASAGVHVLERSRGVAAIGNVVTHPSARGRGYGHRTVGTLCRRLLTEVTTVGLNVAADNLSAVRLYERLGFAEVHAYEEAGFEQWA